MKKFVCKVILLALIVGGIVEIFNCAYKDRMFACEDIPGNLDVVNVGSSHAFYGLSYESLAECDIEGFNFALTGQMPTYDVAILKKNIGKVRKDGVCLISLSWFSFIWDEESEEGFEAKNNRYYSLVDRTYIKQYSIKQDIRYNLLPILFDEKFYLKKYEKSRLTLVDRVWRDDSNTELDFVDHADKSYQGQVEKWDGVLQEEVDAVYEMINICHQNKVKPVLITFPFTKEFNECADEKLDMYFYDIADEIIKDTGVVWYDYSDDKRFVDNKELFMDSNHLNVEGAEVFTKIVKEEILDVMLNEEN